jgi:hypothetical protein
MKKPDTIFFLSDARGIYIPRDFANGIKPECLSGATAEDVAILKNGPDDLCYWDAWDAVLESARVTEDNGTVYTLHQDGDLWLIPVGMEWNEDRDCYAWPEDSADA